MPKKQLSIKHVIQRSTTRWHHCDMKLALRLV